MMISKKSLFKSRTFWGIVLTAIVAIAPELSEAIDKNQLKISTIVKLIGVGCGSVLSVTGRLYAKDMLFTDDILPGPNKEDLPD